MKLRKTFNFFPNFGRELLPVKLLLLAHYGARNFLFAGLSSSRMRRRCRVFCTAEQRQEASTTFAPHRETGQSDTQKHGK